jgi:beta-glucosidase
MLGLAAIGDEELVQRFADIARQEYRAIGIRVALHPTADLATESRWARIRETFGEDANLTSRLIAAHVGGFQGPRLGKESVAAMVKHFPGGGPQNDGEDAHFSYGREQIYPDRNFAHHLRPFEAAFAAGVSTRASPRNALRSLCSGTASRRPAARRSCPSATMRRHTSSGSITTSRAHM